MVKKSEKNIHDAQKLYVNQYMRKVTFEFLTVWAERVFVKLINLVKLIKWDVNPPVYSEVFAIVKFFKEGMVSIWE